METLIREDFTDKREQFSEEELAADLKDRLRKLGFYRDPPTPELLREAKHVYQTLDWPRLQDPDGNPLPCPPKSSKYEVLDDDDRLDELDEYAIQVSTSYINAPVQDLVEHLIQPTSSDVEKARVLTRWLGRCLEEDYQRYIPRSGTITAGTTACYLRRLKQREIDYDELFQVLCRYAEIKSQAISGCVRNTVKYEVGDDFRGQRKTWTAALLDGDWRLLDVRWICEAAYGVAKKKWRLIEDDKGKVNPRKAFKEHMGSFKTQARFREYYFLTDPEIFIFDHFPDEERWQLLARPLSYEEARDSAALRADFFRLGMSVKTNPTCVCENDEGQTTFVFGLEDDESVSFVYKLYQDKDCKSNVVSGREKLERYVFLERDMDDKVVRVVIRYPSEGKYLFELHGSETQETHHSILCTYMIFCTGILEDCRPLPPNIRKEWGPSTDTKEMGLTPLTHRKGQVEAEDGDAQIKFGLSKDLEFRHDLIHGEKEVPLSERHVIHTVEDGKVNINLRLPKPGEYALNVMAKERNKGVAFAPACTYLVSCEDEPLQSTPFPDIVDGTTLGPTEDFAKLGFTEDDPWPSYITNLVTGELNMEIKRPPSMQVYATLVYEGENSENFNNYVICDKDKERVFINTTFPKHGTYKLSLYARPPNGGHPDKDILIYVKVIEVMLPTLSGMPGPIQFMSDWCNDCYIKEPRKCYLASDERQKISISLPDAREITIKDHPECRMRKTKDALWEGFVKTGPSGSVLEVMATPKSEEKPAKILTYQIVSKEKLLDIEMKQEAQFKEALDQLQRFEEEKLNRLLAKLRQAMEEKSRVKLQRYLARMQELNTGKMDDIIEQADYLLQELVHEEEKIVARKELRRATRVCDIGCLEAALAKFKRLNLQSEDGDLHAAEEMLQGLLMKRAREQKHKMVDSAQQTTDAIQPQVQQQLQSSMQYMNQMRSGVHIYVMQEPPGPQFNGFSGPTSPDFMGSSNLKVEIRDAMSQTSEDTGVMSLNDSSSYPSGVIEPQRRSGYFSPYTSTPRKPTYTFKQDREVEVPRFGFHNHSPTNIDDGGDEIEGKSRDDDEEVDEFQAAEAVLKEIELSENIGKVKKLVRDNMREASALQNEAALHRAIEDFKRLNMEEEAGDLSFAEDRLDSLHCLKRVSPVSKDKTWKAKTMNVFKNYWKRMKEESQVASESIDDEIENEIQRLRHINQMCRKMSVAARKIGNNWNALIKSEQSFTELLDESYDKLTEDMHNTSALQHEVITAEEGMKNAFDKFSAAADEMCAQLIAKADTVARELENSRVELLTEEMIPDDFARPGSPRGAASPRTPRSPRTLIKGQGARSMSPGQSLMKTKAQMDVAKTAYYALRSNILEDMRKTNAETEDEIRRNLSDLQVMMAEFHGVGTPRSFGTLDTSSEIVPSLKLDRVNDVIATRMEEKS